MHPLNSVCVLSDIILIVYPEHDYYSELIVLRTELQGRWLCSGVKERRRASVRTTVTTTRADMSLLVFAMRLGPLGQVSRKPSVCN
jgi:hypothetical protein